MRMSGGTRNGKRDSLVHWTAESEFVWRLYRMMKENHRRRLRHEFTHAYLHVIYARPLPRWFNEGVAEFYAY